MANKAYLHVEDEQLVGILTERDVVRLSAQQTTAKFMQSQEIKRVCCLLPESQLARYANLLG